MCSVAIKNPTHLFNIENDLLKMFLWTEECVSHITSLPLDQINDVLTEEEKRNHLRYITIVEATLPKLEGYDDVGR
jgi:hypothetical protein